MIIKVKGTLEEASHPATVYLFENSARNPLDLGAHSVRVLRPLFEGHGLQWKGFHAGRGAG
jgi:hypothetical protein